MKTVHEVSQISGISVRTLHYYDAIGLLKPTTLTESGYRLYDDAALSKLQSILLFRELQFPLKEIRAILERPDFDRQTALEQQLQLLQLQKKRLDRLISLARKMINEGGTSMDFSAFDNTELAQYAAEAKQRWGSTDAYQESCQRSKGRTAQDHAQVAQGLMDVFAKFGAVKDGDPASPQAQALAAELQQYITDHYYTCTPQILSGLGAMYTADPRFQANIDRAGGPGTADFASRAIAVFCKP